MSGGADAKYGFLVDWFDSQAELTRRYKMTYYVRNNNPEGNEVDLYDVKNNRTFLKRVAVKNIDEDDLFIGSKVTIFSRQMTIADFADPITKAKFSKASGFLVLQTVEGNNWGKMLQTIESNFKVTRMKMLQFTAGEVTRFCDSLDGGSQDQFSYTCRPNQNLLALELSGKEGIGSWSSVSQRFPPSYADGNASSLEQIFGGQTGTSSAVIQDCTCCVVKPHAVKARATGQIVTDIQTAGMSVSAIQLFELDRDATEEFLEVYKGVAPGYKDIVSEMCSGPLVGLCVNASKQASAWNSGGNYNVVTDFRKLAGPFEFDFAQQLRPDTLRAKYGKDSTRNAIHCTDLPEDGEIDCEYLFRLQQ